MTNVEQELVTVLKFKKKFTNRQKFLHALLVAIDDKERFTDDDYDNLSDEAAEWHQAAVGAKDRGIDLPDFENGTTEEPPEKTDEPDEPDEADDDAIEEPEPDEEPENGDGKTTSEENGEDDSDNGDDGEAEPDSRENGSADDGPVEPEPDSELEEYKADQAAEVKKKDKRGGNRGGKKGQKKAKVIGSTPPPPAQPDPDYEKLTGQKDRYGCFVGTKTAQAIKMYEKGAYATDISHTLGGRYYNILTKLASQGHRVEKTEENKWKLTHKDDATGRAKPSPYKKQKVKA